MMHAVRYAVALSKHGCFPVLWDPIPISRPSQRDNRHCKEAGELPEVKGLVGTGLWEQPALSPGPGNGASAWRLQNTAAVPCGDGPPRWPPMKQVQGQILARPREVL